jgi:photosystem II stability/assembly factor-like uncharacterized protein
MKRVIFLLILIGFFLSPLSISAKKKAEEKKKEGPMNSATFMGMKLRNIGPAFTGGRIADFAVNPKDNSEYYVAVAAGNVFKTNNAGVTWKPIFDKYGSWSISDVEIDPNNTSVVWIGTGEYNSQRAIGYGDGVYRSEDGGKSWKNVGLKESQHIGRIIIDPRNSHVYVAAQGPLWGPGGERGLYKSTDNGKTWKDILTISKDTGITDIVMDPSNPDILYAASYQRRRRVFTLINGGPESAIYKSTDAGANWTKLKSGLPSGDVGRIGLTISPANPDVVYAIIEAEGKSGGFFRTTNRGATWTKRSSHISRSPQYYNRIFADPKNVEKVYTVETVSKVTVDGGKTFKDLGLKSRHVDDHALWINPSDTRHLLIGGDGGIYESFDSGALWNFKDNLPITQFYRVSVDNREPFYYVYGGTQDNNSMGGPSKTLSMDGIVNSDWFVTNGGDGFKSQVDPTNPDIIYAQSQYGGLVRYDKKGGESIYLQPIEGKDEAYRWNWNAPLIISPHSHTRLYFAANILFRSDDRGNTWKKVSGDLTRQLDRNKLPVMGKVQSPDAVAKNASTSLFGNIVSLDESKLKEGLIYVGTDDGLIQVTKDGGANWSKNETLPGVPKMTYVSCLFTSPHDVNTVYASFDARKDSDLKPYLIKSTDQGKTWTSIASNLPKRGTVYSIVEDFVKKDLLFAGTEFGLYFSIDGGKKWVQLKGGIPTTAVRDIVFQEREHDLVLATFGRGFYILDNIAPLREITAQVLKKENHLFAVKDALTFVVKRSRYGTGSSYYKAKNPKFGAAITYYMKDSIKTLKQKRKAAEKKSFKAGKTIIYPSFDQLRAEDNEPKPYLLFTIKDDKGNVVRKLRAAASAGIKRITWDLRYHNTEPATISKTPFGNKDSGMPVLPGKYTVTMAKIVKGEWTQLQGSQTFNVKPLNNATLPAKDPKVLADFLVKLAEMGRVVRGTAKATQDLETKIKHIKAALHRTPSATQDMFKKAEIIHNQLKEIRIALRGDRSISKRNANQPPSLSGRMGTLMYIFWRTTSTPTETAKTQYKIISEEMNPILTKLKKLINEDIKQLEMTLEKIKAPWTPGRIPVLENN